MDFNLGDLPRELSLCSNLNFKLNEPLSNHCSYGVGGIADIYIQPLSITSLINAFDIAKKHKAPIHILGNGTNVLFSDKGFRGVVISTKNLTSIEVNGNIIQAECGAQIGSIINKSVERGLSGLEKLAGIPATVGGAVTMNASAFGTAVSDKLLSVTVFERDKITSYSHKDCDFGYRKSRFQVADAIILFVTFNLDDADESVVNKNCQQCLSLRKSIQPLGRSCGSVFRNTTKYSAGQLIDMSGLKGKSIGGAFVSNKHANFILTQDGATAYDVFRLIKLIKKEVFEKFGIILQEEIKFIGEF